MWATLQKTRKSHRYDSWAQFLSHMKSESLTLVGFEGKELWKMYDALEACARSKDIQTVEVFIRTIDEVSEDDLSVSPGLCLVRVPEPTSFVEHRIALMALDELAESEALAVIPVLKPYIADGESLKAVGLSCPIYMNIDSGVEDYVAIFSAYLFPRPNESRELVKGAPKARRKRYVTVEDNV